MEVSVANTFFVYCRCHALWVALQAASSIRFILSINYTIIWKFQFSVVFRLQCLKLLDICSIDTPDCFKMVEQTWRAI